MTLKADELMAEGGRKMIVTLQIAVPRFATVGEVRAFLYELECAGGCRSPDDPMFDSIGIIRESVMVTP